MPYHQVGKHSTTASAALSRATWSATPPGRGGGVVGAPLGGGQDRVEPLGVEVAIVDLVAAAAQRRHHGSMQRRGEAVGERVGVDDEDAHPRACSRRLLEAVAQHAGRAARRPWRAAS